MAEELDERSGDIMPFDKSIMPFTNCQDGLHYTKHVNVDRDEDDDVDGDEQTGIMDIKRLCNNQMETGIFKMQSSDETLTIKSIDTKSDFCDNEAENDISRMQSSDDVSTTKSSDSKSGLSNNQKEHHSSTMQCSDDTLKTKSININSGFCDSEEEIDISTKQSSDEKSKTNISSTKSGFCGSDEENDISTKQSSDETPKTKNSGTKSGCPIFGIVTKETDLTDRNQIYWQTFGNIHSTPNYTFLLQDMNFVPKKAVNEKVLFKDVDSSFNNLLECDNCKGEIHNLCSHGTAYLEEHGKKSDTIITQNLNKANTIENSDNNSDFEEHEKKSDTIITQNLDEAITFENTGNYSDNQKAKVSVQEFIVNKWRKRKKVQQGIDGLYGNFEEHGKKSDTTITQNLEEAITIENIYNNSESLKGKITRQEFIVNTWKKRKKVQHGTDGLHENHQKAEISRQEFKVNKWRKRKKVQQGIDGLHGNFKEHGKKSDTTITQNLDEATTIENTHNNSESLKGKITRQEFIVNTWKKRKKVQHGTDGLHENDQKAGISRHELKVNTWRKRKKVHQGINGLHGKNERSKFEATDTGLLLIVFLLSFCKVSTHEYILVGVMMMLPVGYSDDIPTNSLKLVLVGDIIYGKTVVLECMTENRTGLCDLENKSRRWTQGSRRIQLVTNGKSVNESKFEEVVNKNCTHLELKLKNFKEMDMNMEYTFEYGFQMATLNLTLNKSSYKWYPLVETVVNDVHVSHQNLTMDLTFRNINPIPNCTVILENISFPLEILYVNESTFYYDVVFRFTHLIECVRCKEEIRILCSSLGTTYEYEKNEYYECCLGSMAEQNVSMPTVVSIIVSTFGVAAAIFLILKQKRKNIHQGATNTQHIALGGLITTTQLHTMEPLILAESENLRNS